MKEKFCFFIMISLKFVSKGPIDNKSALIQVMVPQTGDKSLPEAILIQLYAYIQH